MKKIGVFDGEYAFLSNFYPSPVMFLGLTFPTSENAFQAQKCYILTDKEQFLTLTPGQAKRRGRKVNLRPDWEQLKDEVMYRIVDAKFRQNSNLRYLLVSTGDAYLEEGNTWGDTYWGVCNGVGQNKLGEILMRVRSELRQ